MLKKTFFLFTAIVSAASFAGPQITTEYQCWALGNKFRSGGGDNLVESRIAFNLKIDAQKKDQAGEATLGYIGHVAFAKFVDGATKIELFDGYSQFAEEGKASSLAPRARKYADADYFRFRSVNETASTSHDGGGMNGYLVISKKALTVASAEAKFDAHYVFQHGDHTGGTLDYTCKKE